jgi:Transposase
MKSGDRVKTDRRDAMMLAKLHRAGELTAIWIPDAAHEAMRDLVRARATAGRVLSKARQHLQGFLLRHDRIYRGARACRALLRMKGAKHRQFPSSAWVTTHDVDVSSLCGQCEFADWCGEAGIDVVEGLLEASWGGAVAWQGGGETRAEERL